MINVVVGLESYSYLIFYARGVKVTGMCVHRDLDHLAAQGYEIVYHGCMGMRFINCYHTTIISKDGKEYTGSGETLSEAICRAALRTSDADIYQADLSRE